MSKKPEKKPIEQKPFSNSEFKKSMGLGVQNVKDKEKTWIPFNKGFYDAIGVPGVPRGYVSQFRGFSDVGKSTGIYETIAGAQKLGDFIVIYDSEKSFDWDHAKKIGFQFTEVADEDGVVINYEGEDFIYLDGLDLLKMYECYDYKESKMKTTPLRFIPVVEDVARHMNFVLDAQARGELRRNITFVWDSIGSIGCFQGAMSSTNNNQWTAGALKRDFESILNYRIPASRREVSEFINTFVTVQKIWLRPNAVGQPTIMHNGGEGFKYGVRMLFHLGGKMGSSSKKLDAVSNGQSFNYGVKVEIECVKNHVNGIEKKGAIASTSHGFWNPDELNDYKKQYKDYINAQLGRNYAEIGDYDGDDDDIELIEGDEE
jgi:hypothetical protein